MRDFFQYFSYDPSNSGPNILSIINRSSQLIDSKTIIFQLIYFFFQKQKSTSFFYKAAKNNSANEHIHQLKVRELPLAGQREAGLRQDQQRRHGIIQSRKGHEARRVRWIEEDVPEQPLRVLRRKQPQCPEGLVLHIQKRTTLFNGFCPLQEEEFLRRRPGNRRNRNQIERAGLQQSHRPRIRPPLARQKRNSSTCLPQHPRQ